MAKKTDNSTSLAPKVKIHVSKVADVKQCLIEGEADAIYGARLQSRFVNDTPWIHVDLCGYRREGGLGAVGSDVNGFGVAWGIALLEKQLGPQGPSSC